MSVNWIGAERSSHVLSDLAIGGAIRALMRSRSANVEKGQGGERPPRPPLPPHSGGTMNPLRTIMDRLDALSTRWIARSGIRLRPSITLLRLSLGLVFLGFGVLKFDPGLSPAEGLAKETMDKLTLGLVPKS